MIINRVLHCKDEVDFVVMKHEVNGVLVVTKIDLNRIRARMGRAATNSSGGAVLGNGVVKARRVVLKVKGGCV